MTITQQQRAIRQAAIQSRLTSPTYQAQVKAGRRRRRISNFRAALGILVGLAIVGAGVVFDLSFFLIGGIEEIIRGVQAHPMSDHDIAFGIVRVLCSGIGFTVGIILGWFVAHAVAGE